MIDYQSPIILGNTYRDQHIGFTGVAENICFHQHGCPRVALRTLLNGNVIEQVFDGPNLMSNSDGQLGFTS